MLDHLRLVAASSVLLHIVNSATTSSKSYLTWMADTFIANTVSPLAGYGEAVLYDGFQAAYELNNDKTYIDWYLNQINGHVVLSDGTMATWNAKFSLDNFRIGNNLLYLYTVTGETKYKTAAETIRIFMNQQPRNSEGGFWHRSPVYPNQMWLDGIFMADSFYSRWTATFDKSNTTAWDDIILQYDLIEKHCRHGDTGLLNHGYDGSKVAVWANPVTGSAPHVWDRADGWYFLSLLESIQVFPQSHPGYQRLVEYYETLAAALQKFQDESGGWWLVMDPPYPGMAGNYIEASGSFMFTAGMLKGMRLGLLDKSKYLSTAKNAYKTLVDKFVEPQTNGTLILTGTVNVGSLGSNGSYEYYIGVPTNNNDYKGTGPFMLASYEWETWANEA